MIKAVLFDAIDTLFCANPTKNEMYRRIIKEKLGLEVTEEQMAQAWDKVIEATEEVAREEIRHRKNIGAWDGFNARILKELDYRGNLQDGGNILLYESWANPNNFRVYEDVPATLKYLKENNIKIGCVSNEMSKLVDFFPHFGIEEYFECVIVSEEVGIEKPNPKIFLAGVEYLSVENNECIFIGDSIISDYAGSKEAGLVPVLIDRNHNCSDNNVTTINNLYDIKAIIEGVNQNACTTT